LTDTPYRRFLAPTLFLWYTQVSAAIATQLVFVLAPEMARDLKLDPALIGVYSTIMWVVAGLVSLPAGELSDRFGGARVAQSTLLLSTLSLGVAALGHPIAFVCTAIMLGAAWALQGPAGARVLIRVVPPRHRSLMFSVRQTGVQAGFLIASLCLPLLNERFGWRGTAWLLVAILGVLLLVFRPLVRGIDEAAGTGVSDAPRAKLSDGVQRVRRDPVLQGLGVAIAVYSPTQFCMNGFFVVYAVSELGATLAQAAALLGIAQAAAFGARLFWGFVADRYVRPLTLLVALGVAMAVCGIAIGALTADVNRAVLGLLVFCMGATSGGWNGVLLAEIARRAPDAAGLVTGTLQAINYVGLIVAPILVAAAGAAGSYGAGFILVCSASLGAAAYLHHCSRRAQSPTARA
jgi:MFS family permease